eukprot:s393_g19.t1
MVATKGLNLSALRRVRGLWKEELQSVTLTELWGGQTAERDEAGCLHLARQTQYQLKVRMGHRLQDFLFLPYKAMADPAVRTLYSKYVNAYTIHEEFDDLRRPEDVAKYWVALAEIFEENQNVTSLLGMARRRIIRLDPGLAPTFDNFVSSFLVSRIGTHLLGSAFFQQVPAPSGGKKPAGVAMGVLQPTSPASLLGALVESFKGQHPEYAVPVDIQGNTETSILYIPGHLRGILREVLHNAMRETASNAEVWEWSQALDLKCYQQPTEKTILNGELFKEKERVFLKKTLRLHNVSFPIGHDRTVQIELVRPLYKRGFSVVLLDLPGSGGSSLNTNTQVPYEDWEEEDFRIVENALRGLQVKRTHLIAFGRSSRIILKFAKNTHINGWSTFLVTGQCLKLPLGCFLAQWV